MIALPRWYRRGVRKLAAAFALSLLVTMGSASQSASWSQDRAIIPAETARKQWAWLYRSGATPWTPALADVLALEKGLPDYIRHELNRQRRDPNRDPDSDPRSKNPLWERAKRYKRQFVGVQSEGAKGRRTVFANFFCNDWGRNWRTEPISVDDGGDCYFTVEYDVGKGTFSNLSINGEA